MVLRAGVAHLAERDLPKVEVAGSSPVSRSSFGFPVVAPSSTAGPKAGAITYATCRSQTEPSSRCLPLAHQPSSAVRRWFGSHRTSTRESRLHFHERVRKRTPRRLNEVHSDTVGVSIRDACCNHRNRVSLVSACQQLPKPLATRTRTGHRARLSRPKEGCACRRHSKAPMNPRFSCEALSYVCDTLGLWRAPSQSGWTTRPKRRLSR